MDKLSNLSVSEEMIQQLNKNAAPDGTGGIYRKGPHSDGAAPEDIQRLMGHLAEQICSSRFTLSPAELAAMAERRLLEIRPFESANEETGRALKNAILNDLGCIQTVDGSTLFSDSIIIK